MWGICWTTEPHEELFRQLCHIIHLAENMSHKVTKPSKVWRCTRKPLYRFKVSISNFYYFIFCLILNHSMQLLAISPLQSQFMSNEHFALNSIPLCSFQIKQIIKVPKTISNTSNPPPTPFFFWNFSYFFFHYFLSLLIFKHRSSWESLTKHTGHSVT